MARSCYSESTAGLVVRQRQAPLVVSDGGRGRAADLGRRESRSALSRTSIKKAVAKRGAPRRRVFGWGELLRGLPTPEARSGALGRFRAGGFEPDDFGSSRPAREAMADALARTEDELELRRARTESIRHVRRRLEQELWP